MNSVELWKDPSPRKWLFYGDSITHGAYHTGFGRDYTQVFSEHVRVAMGRGLDLVLNTARSGDTTRDLLESFDWRVGQFSPQVLFLMIGMNDCGADRVPIAEYRKNLHLLLDRAEAIGALPILQTANPIIPGQAPDREPNYSLFMDVVREISTERSLMLIDHERQWATSSEFAEKWMNDPIHPNAAGHIEIARYLLQHLEAAPALET